MVKFFGVTTARPPGIVMEFIPGGNQPSSDHIGDLSEHFHFPNAELEAEAKRISDLRRKLEEIRKNTAALVTGSLL